MKKLIALLLLICMAGMAVAQDKMADQLRKAIVEEEANQNLDKAITAYNSIIEQYDKQRVTAATALFHLADCYRKQGKKEPAIEAYQRIVREFPEQTKLADASRNYLTSVYNIRMQQDIEVMASDLETLIKDHYTAYNAHDIEKFLAFHTDDVFCEIVIADGVIVQGKKELADVINSDFEAFPDLKMEITSFFASGNQISEEFVISGTHKRNFQGIPATGKNFSVRGALIREMREGKTSRVALYYDSASLMKQLVGF